jgi:hypothetical protein
MTTYFQCTWTLIPRCCIKIGTSVGAVMQQEELLNQLIFEEYVTAIVDLTPGLKHHEIHCVSFTNAFVSILKTTV